MLSGQGRHRRPRQAPAIVVAAGVTGSAIAIPLLGATGAHAADATTWDKVAECESGGAWSAKGDGYYGGLQLTQETWENYGGLAYAPSADQASRSQQIAVADKILADQGPAAWPNCGPTAGLSKDGKAADVDPGLPVAPTKPAEPSDDAKGEKDAADGEKGDKGAEDSADADDEDATGKESGKHRKPDNSGSNGEGDDAEKGKESGKKGNKGERGADEDGKSGDRDSASPDAESEAGREPTGSDDSADASEDPSSDSPSGRHRGSSADEADKGGKGDAGSAGRHASRGEGRDARDATDPASTYTVRSGDNLSQIADRHDLDGGWSTLYAENKRTVGGDPDLILPGQRLDLSEDQAAEAGRK